MALRKVNGLEIDLNAVKDSMWRLTHRVFILEDFIKKQFGDVLEGCCSLKGGKKPKLAKVRKPSVKPGRRSPINLRKRQPAKPNVWSDTDEEEDESAPSASSSLRIKKEYLSEPYTDDEFEGEENDSTDVEEIEDVDMNHSSEHSPGFDEDYDPVAPPLPHIMKDKQEPELRAQIVKPMWTHLKDFVNKEAAEAELNEEWAFQYTITDADGTKTTFHCKHEIGTCPAKVRLVSLNNIESVSYFTNNIDHVHSEDVKYGFNFSTKKIIDALIAEGVTEEGPMMKALNVRNIVVEQKFVNRYLGGHKKQLGLFNKSPTAKRLSYKVSFKLMVVEKAEKVGNKQAAREFNIDEANVRKWRKSKAVLEQLEPQRSSLRGKGAKWPNLEKELVSWISGQKEAGEKITTEFIRQEASRIAQRLNLLDFSSSKGWLERFTKRHGESFARHKAKKKIEETKIFLQEKIETEITTLTNVPTDISSQSPTEIVITQNLSDIVEATVNPDGIPLTTAQLENGFPVNSWYVQYVQQN